MDYLGHVRKLVEQRVAQLNPKLEPDTWATLAGINWSGMDGVADQSQVGRESMAFLPSNCLGRAAIAGYVLEHHFKQSVELGEVRSDYLRNLLQGKVRAKSGDPTFLCELLMYEEPHAVAMVEGTQYETLSIALGHYIDHPEIASVPFWTGLTATWMVSLASTQDPVMRLATLDAAEQICPALSVVAENRASALLLLDRDREAILLAEYCQTVRPTARTAYFLYLLTGEDRWATWLRDTYTEQMLDYLGKEVI